jgi:hypothetical protein
VLRAGLLGALSLVAGVGVSPPSVPVVGAPGPPCLTVPVPPVSAPARPLRFGITPLLAGSAGGVQQPSAPDDPARDAAALRALRPAKRTLVMRINRVFESDGRTGIKRAVSLARRYARMGFGVESQVRYHPSDAQNGDMAAWTSYVRQVVRALAANRSLVALTITNEVNFPISSNTSDGSFKNALDALVRGVVAARAELRKRGRSGVALGFSYAYRYLPDQDAAFWKGIGARATPAFLSALNYVGVQLYPGLVFPPVLAPGQSAGDATLDALALVRDCYMPLANLGRRVRLWITENGYATNLGHSEAQQLANLNSTLAAVHRYSGTFGVSDYRYFNLRDNRAGGTDLFDDVGLMRADYSRKPSFGAFRRLVRRYGR